MKKCSPVEMRKNLVIVDQLRMAGIDFVPVPVKSQEHKYELIVLVQNAFEELLKDCE